MVGLSPERWGTRRSHRRRSLTSRSSGAVARTRFDSSMAFWISGRTNPRTEFRRLELYRGKFYKGELGRDRWIGTSRSNLIHLGSLELEDERSSRPPCLMLLVRECSGGEIESSFAPVRLCESPRRGNRGSGITVRPTLAAPTWVESTPRRVEPTKGYGNR